MTLRVTKMHYTDQNRANKVLVTFYDEDLTSSSVFNEETWGQIEKLLTNQKSTLPITIEDES